MDIINPIHKAPYTNFHDLNLDWIIEVLNEFNTKLTNFVSLATIKYADPIQWDITSQYEATGLRPIRSDARPTNGIATKCAAWATSRYQRIDPVATPACSLR